MQTRGVAAGLREPVVVHRVEEVSSPPNEEVAPGKIPHHRPLVWLMQWGTNGDEEAKRRGQGSIPLSSPCTTVLVVGHQKTSLKESTIRHRS